MPVEFHPLHSDAPVIVYMDIKSPYAFVAKNPTYALEQDLGVSFDWRPLTLDIPSYLGSAKLGKQGQVVENKRSKSQWSGVKYAYMDARRYARSQGHVLRGTEKIWDTTLAHLGFAWAKTQGNAALRRYLDHVYPPFWRRELDLDNINVVTQLLIRSDVDCNGFDDYCAGPGRETHAQQQQQIFTAGVFGVPTYVVAGHKFFGREHLPMVRWLAEQVLANPDQPIEDLAGAPDIGYDIASSVLSQGQR